MSRIGKMPIKIPQDVNVQVYDHSLTVSGSLGQLSQTFRPEVKLTYDEGQITVERTSDSKMAKSLHGLTRTLIANMIIGVTKGFEKELELQGVGYRAALEGDNLVLSVGYSHPVTVNPPLGIKVSVSENKIKVWGIDKSLVGQIASDIRRLRPPDPYKGKGIRYLGEEVRLKPGKKALGQVTGR